MQYCRFEGILNFKLITGDQLDRVVLQYKGVSSEDGPDLSNCCLNLEHVDAILHVWRNFKVYHM